MGTGRGNHTNGNEGVNQVPTSSKKLIQNLKEIVNCSEAEIYATLKECNMDPNEAVSRLLSQDPFHEVKSKREKKKEAKDVGDSKSRITGSTSSRGGRSGADWNSSHDNMASYGASDSSASRGKATYKRENVSTPYTSSAVCTSGNESSRRQPPVSDTTVRKTLSYNAVDTIPVAPPSSGYQSAWSGMPGQMSMADIVRMGRPRGKPSSTSTTSQQHVNNLHPSVSFDADVPHDMHTLQNHSAKGLEENFNWSMSGNVPPNDDWPLEENPPVDSGVSTILKPPVDSEPYGDPYDRTDQQFIPQADEVRFEDNIAENAHDSVLRNCPESNQNIHEDDSDSGCAFHNELYQNTSSYQVHHREVEDTSASLPSMTQNFQSLSLQKEDENASSEEEEEEEEGPAVKIPDHLRFQSAECSHLSFGSFGSGTNAPLPGSFGSRAVQSNEEASVFSEAPLVAHSEARNPEYYEEEHLRTTPDVNTAHRMGDSSGNFDTPSVSQADMLKQEAPDVPQANQYSFPSSTANYAFENTQQLNASFANSQASSQMQGLPLSGVMSYSNALPSSLLLSNVQPLRDADLAYSSFPISQSMASKYSNSVSSISNPTVSIAEALRSGNFSASQATQTQNLPSGSSVSGGAALPQHLAVHPYSQSSVPMGPFAAANMMGYPFLPQSYAYLPSAFQQAFATGNSTYPQSLAAAMPPQYKNNASVSNLPQSAAIASGYSAFGNSNNNFTPNPPSAPVASLNYNDLLNSQYKEGSHLSLQQGPGSRTPSGVPGNAYYNSFQGQNQQPAGFRQNQQPQHYGALSGYPNFYHSQSGLSLDHQQLMSRDGSVGGSQGQQQPKQTQQIWHNRY
ncbi:unnamed protein product [Amaranthus hypochondriacus]